MKECFNCKAKLADDAIFCTECGTKLGESGQSLDQAAIERSLVLKYSSYLDNGALFNVAWAKEQGIVKSDIPDEAEIIYKMLALKGHHGAMFRYAMIQLAKLPPKKEDAVRWLSLAASQGHVESINYLKTTGLAPVPMSNVSEVNHVPGMSGEEVFATMKRSVVEIYVSDSASTASASGFFVSSTGFIMTNAHAVLNRKGKQYEKIQIKYNEKYYEAKVVAVGKPVDGRHDTVDLALLFAFGVKDAVAAKLGDSNACRNGQKVYLIGNSRGQGTCITSGIISDAKREMSGLSYPYIMTDAAANPGNSGGPLVSESAEVIGVLVSGITEAEGMNYAIPVNMVKEFLAYVALKSNFPSTVLGELNVSAPKTMSVRDRIFSGIHLLLDVVAFILSIF